MYVTDLKKEFYDNLVGQRVLLLVSLDVDAVCACKILQYLFQCDHIQYTLIHVNGREDLISEYRKQGKQVRHVVMINCGGTYDVLDLLEPSNEVTFYIADSHRPVDVINIYNDSQVKLLMKLDDSENVPEFEQLFRDDESDNSDEDDEDNPSSKRKRFDPEYLERRRQKRLWMEQRQKIMFDYSQFSYYGISTATTFFELAWKMSKDTNDLLWWAIIGLTEQYLSAKIEHNSYLLEMGSLQGHVTRHNHRGDDDSVVTVDAMKINFEKELSLNLYRHWSLLESIKTTMYTACKFKLWTLKGKKRLYEFLADLGLPLVQCKQKFSSMDMLMRSNVKTWIEEKSSKYGLDSMFYGSFWAQYGFKHKFCAADLALSVRALLESYDKEKTDADKFLDALDCLSRSQIKVLNRGLDLAKKQQVAISRQVQAFLDMNHIVCAGPFLYGFIQEGTPDLKFFTYPECLTVLARFLLNAHVSVSRSRKAKNLPLVLTSASYIDEGMCIVVGIPPLSEDTPKNFFGKAFEQAGQRTNCLINNNYFDSSVIQMRTDDRTKFFDALISLLS